MIRYREGYKYQLAADYTVQTEIILPEPVVAEYIGLAPDGSLFIKEGYAWDGASGPTIDTRNTMRASLVHDALYQLMRAELLDRTRWRETADDILRRLLREDGMSAFRAWYYYRAVRAFGESSVLPSNENPELSAP